MIALLFHPTEAPIMDYNRADLKIAAREALRNRRPSPRLVTLLFLLLSQGPVFCLAALQALLFPQAVAFHSSHFSNAVYLSPYPQGLFLMFLFFGILISLFSAFLQVGYLCYSMRLYRRQDAGCRDLFAPFSQVGQILSLFVLLLLYSLLWALVFAIPAGALLYLFISLDSALTEFFSFLLTLSLWAAVLSRILRYALSFYVLLDHPEYRARDCIAESKRLMAGRRWSFCVLLLSFLGWFFLVALIIFAVYFLAAIPLILLTQYIYLPTLYYAIAFLAFLLGIACSSPLSLWLIPYLAAAFAGFYDCAAGQAIPTFEPFRANGPYQMEPPKMSSEDSPSPSAKSSAPPSYYSGFARRRDQDDEKL